MRLTDFLVTLLLFHSRVLQALQDLLGEEALLVVLEKSAEEEGGSFSYSDLARLSPAEGAKKIQALRSSPVSPYDELEAAVSSSGLHHALQFHLWAYPSYRALIESPLDLELPLGDKDAQDTLLQESLSHAKAWYAGLILPKEIRVQSDPVVSAAWTWLTTEIRKRRGEKGLKSLS